MSFCVMHFVGSKVLSRKEISAVVSKEAVMMNMNERKAAIEKCNSLIAKYREKGNKLILSFGGIPSYMLPVHASKELANIGDVIGRVKYVRQALVLPQAFE